LFREIGDELIRAVEQFGSLLQQLPELCDARIVQGGWRSVGLEADSVQAEPLAERYL